MLLLNAALWLTANLTFEISLINNSLRFAFRTLFIVAEKQIEPLFVYANKVTASNLFERWKVNENIVRIRRCSCINGPQRCWEICGQIKFLVSWYGAKIVALAKNSECKLSFRYRCPDFNNFDILVPKSMLIPPKFFQVGHVRLCDTHKNVRICWVQQLVKLNIFSLSNHCNYA